MNTESLLEKKVSRRQFTFGLAISPFVLGSILTACTKEQKPNAAPVFNPHPLYDPNRPYHNKVIDMLKPGQTVDILEGIFEIDPRVNKRLYPSTPNYQDCTEVDKYFCDRAIDYQGGLRSEIVVNPLGNASEITYFSPRHGKAVWVKIKPDDTDELIKRYGITLKDLKTGVLQKAQQKAVIDRVWFDANSSKRIPAIIAKIGDSPSEPILKVLESKILGIF